MDMFVCKSIPLQVYPKVIHCTTFEHFGLFVSEFWVMLQTRRQTDGLKDPTHADRHSRHG